MFKLSDLSLVLLLVLVSISDLINPFPNNDYQETRLNAFQQNLMANLQDQNVIKLNKLDIAEELYNWPHLSQNLIGLSSSAREDLERTYVIGAHISDSNCKLAPLRSRLDLMEKYDQNYINLNPYLKFMNMMQFHVCYQLNDVFMDEEILQVPRDIWLAWYNMISFEEPIIYDAFKDDTMESIITSLANSSNQIMRVPSIKPENLANLIARIAFYLKLYVPKIESENYDDELDHIFKIRLEIVHVLSSICPILIGYHESQKEPAIEYDNFLRATKPKFGFKQNVGPHQQLYDRKFLCNADLDVYQLARLVMRYFKAKLDYPTIDKEENIDFIKAKKMISSKINKGAPLIRSRMKNPVHVMEIVRREVDRTENLDERLLLKELSDLEIISKDKCDKNNLIRRSQISDIYDKKYPVLHDYITAMNGLQYATCFQKIGFATSLLVKSTSAVQMTGLEQLRVLMSAKNLANPLDINDVDFERGLADYLYLQSSKEELHLRESFDSVLREKMENICHLVIDHLREAIELYNDLQNIGVNYELGDATRYILSYGKICSIYESGRYEANDIRTLLGLLTQELERDNNIIVSL